MGKKSFRLSIPLKITGIYALVGMLWILLSDRILTAVVLDRAAYTLLATVKGWVFIVATALMLYSLIGRNLEALRHSQEAIRLGEERFHSRYEAISTGVIVQNTDGIITNFNRAATQILGLPAEELSGKMSHDPVWQATREDGTALAGDEHPAMVALRTGRPVHNAVISIFSPESGERRWILVNSEPILEPDTGALKEAVTTFADITDRKLAEEELQRRREHERKIEDEAEDAKKQFYKGTIFSVTDGRLNLVSNGEIDSILAPDSRSVELTSAEDLMEVRALVKQVCLDVGMSEERAHSLITAVGEAAANAVKHAGRGTARVGVKDGAVQVCIEDNGPGIDSLVLPKATLMSRFSTKPSMGLGYSLILALVDNVYLATGKLGTRLLLEKCVREKEQEIRLEVLPDTW